MPNLACGGCRFGLRRVGLTDVVFMGIISNPAPTLSLARFGSLQFCMPDAEWVVCRWSLIAAGLANVDALAVLSIPDPTITRSQFGPNSSKSAPPAIGTSVQSSLPDQLPTDLEPCKVNDPLIPSGPPRLSDSLSENCSESTLVAPKLKEEIDCFSSVTGLQSFGTPTILSQAMSGEGLQLGSECAPDSDPLDVTVASPMSDSENFVYSVDAESAPEVGIPRMPPCPAMLQLCNQQISQLPVPSVGCSSPNSCLPISHSYAEILCRGLDADSQGFLVGGVPWWPISEEDRIAALGLVGASITLDPHPPGVAVLKLESALSLLPPVSEQASGPVSYPPGPLDHAVALVNTPPSISRILTKYSLDTSYQLGHGSSSPNGLSTASSTDSHLDTPEVSYLGSQVAPSQQDSWQPVKSRRNRRSASKDAKAGMFLLKLCSGLICGKAGCSPLDFWMELVLALASAADVVGQALALCWRLIGVFLCQWQCSSLV
ncbi:hypothetical protein Nepgr_002696 [Nepenthes gracilis]|uniref:Uncharacterized protein n=1 Tax=Nepenthes gracilis TaxID=150966 RepID=A0AAD3RX43_NEPGR|nr:hypothetical protein Nepgr_002696 [Nepenthes gracilis]